LNESMKKKKEKKEKKYSNVSVSAIDLKEC
jgi:hypothetical protein